MYNFSLYADNRIAPGLEDKINICSRLLVNNMEVDDKMHGICISSMDGKQTEEVRKLLLENHKKIVMLNCSKPLTDKQYYMEIFRKAHMLHVEKYQD